jgi:serine/threonine protein kinase
MTSTSSDILADAIISHRGPTAPEPDEIAAAFPDLEIEELLGSGGMGAVFRVRERNGGRAAALKLLRADGPGGEAFATRFAREAEALTRLDHPAIVGIHGHGRSGPWCWIRMDLIEGANLREILRLGRLSPAQALALVPPLAGALQYAHDQGVVHRDLKPENILLDRDGRPHLVDFGLAKLRGADPTAALTGSGTVLGTPHYMAPEQVAGAGDVDHRADIYALGVLLYELLTGRLPLGRFESPAQALGLDARLDELVLRALERDPERRWQRVAEMGSRASDLGTPAPATVPPRLFRRGWMVFAGIAAGALWPLLAGILNYGLPRLEFALKDLNISPPLLLQVLVDLRINDGAAICLFLGFASLLTLLLARAHRVWCRLLATSALLATAICLALAIYLGVLAQMLLSPIVRMG